MVRTYRYYDLEFGIERYVFWPETDLYPHFPRDWFLTTASPDTLTGMISLKDWKEKRVTRLTKNMKVQRS